MNENIKNAGTNIAKMLKENAWLQQTKEEELKKLCMEYYNNLNNNNDNDNNNNIHNETQISKRIHQLQEEQASLSSKINHKVMPMFERAENEYRELTNKREIVKEDKKKN